MNYDFAKVGIDDYYKTNYKRHIRFFGAGEPTVEIELVNRILQYAKSKDIKTTSEIQTNGCFSENVASWLSQNVNIIWISSDGVPDFQNYYRPFNGGGKTSDTLEKNIKYLSSHTRGMIGIRTTITSTNYKRQIENIDYFYDLGIKNFWVDPLFPTVGDEQPIEVLDMKEFTKFFYDAVRYAYSKGITYGSILTCNFDEEGQYACRALLPVPHLTTDGYVSACDMALFGKDTNHMSLFIYGKWNSQSQTIDYDKEKISYLRSRTLGNIPKCSKCEAGKYCRGYCPGEVVNETRSLFGCKTKVCGSIIALNRIMTEDEKKYEFSHP